MPTAAVVGVLPYRGGLYDVLPRGGVIARFGVGHDGIDKEKATRAGILCTNTPRTLDRAVAELTILLLLAAARHLPSMTGEMAQGHWSPRTGGELAGRTVVVIGAGRIGLVLEGIARDGLAMRVAALGRNADVHAGVREADFVSVHLPATSDTHHFVDRGLLAAMAPHAWLINTARGASRTSGRCSSRCRQVRSPGPRSTSLSASPAGRRRQRPAALAE